MSVYKGNELIAGHQVLYSDTGQNTDGAMTQKAATDSFVNKSGDTMTGSLNVVGEGYNLDDDTIKTYLGLRNDDIDLGTVPVSNQYSPYILFLDENDKHLAGIYTCYDTNGSTRLIFNCKAINANGTDCYVVMQQNANGTFAYTFPNSNCCDGQWVAKYLRLANGTSINNSSNTSLDISLSSYLPNDRYNYEVYFSVIGNKDSGTTGICYLLTDVFKSQEIGLFRDNGASKLMGGNAIIPVGTDRKISLIRRSSYSGTVIINALGYRRIGTNA